MRLTDRAVPNDIRKVEDIIECILCPINENKEELKNSSPFSEPRKQRRHVVSTMMDSSRDRHTHY